MKLLYIANRRLPTEKTHGLQIAKMCEAFDRVGLDTTLLIPERENSIKVSFKEYYNLENHIHIVYVQDYFPFLFTHVSQTVYLKVNRLIFFLYALLAPLFFRANILYSREIVFCFVASFFTKKIVFEDHEPLQSRKFLYQMMLKKIPRKVVVPHHLARLYDALGVKRQSYIVAPNGVDIREVERTAPRKDMWRSEFGILGDKKIVLFVGHFYAWKGVYTLLDSVKFIEGDAAVVLVGGFSDSSSKKLMAYIRAHSIHNVYIHDFVPHQEAIQYIRSADILVIPNTAKEERSAKYTTPIKLFEYMAAEVPIVASNIPSFEMYLQDGKNSVLCRPDDPRDLALKIDSLISNDEFAQTIALRARADVEEFTWEKRAQKIFDFVSRKDI